MLKTLSILLLILFANYLCFASFSIGITGIQEMNILGIQKANAEEEKKSNWLCYQFGSINEKSFVITTHVFKAETGNYNKKETLFQNTITNEYSKFKPAFDARCEDYSLEKDAIAYYKERLLKYKKRNINVVYISFESFRE